MKTLALLFGLVIFLGACTTPSTNQIEKEGMIPDLKEVVRPFYTKCLTVNPNTDVAEVMGKLLADNFQSIGSVDTKPKAKLIGQLQFFWKLIPDMKWEIQEMLQDGNRVIVRSIASGSPNGDFMGMPTDGGKSFKIMTIDIHTVENGQVVQIYHLDHWRHDTDCTGIPASILHLKP